MLESRAFFRRSSSTCSQAAGTSTSTLSKLQMTTWRPSGSALTTATIPRRRSNANTAQRKSSRGTTTTCATCVRWSRNSTGCKPPASREWTCTGSASTTSSTRATSPPDRGLSKDPSWSPWGPPNAPLSVATDHNRGPGSLLGPSNAPLSVATDHNRGPGSLLGPPNAPLSVATDHTRRPGSPPGPVGAPNAPLSVATDHNRGPGSLLVCLGPQRLTASSVAARPANPAEVQGSLLV